MVKVIGVPGQPFAVGVTVMVATTGTVPALIAVNDGIGPVPFAPSPIEGSLLVQLKTVPATDPENGIATVVCPAQYETLVTGFTFGIGLTVTIMVTGKPTQPDARVSITCKVQVPTLFQVTVIELLPFPVMVPLPLAIGIILQV
jgi:hypothetical protein